MVFRITVLSRTYSCHKVGALSVWCVCARARVCVCLCVCLSGVPRYSRACASAMHAKLMMPGVHLRHTHRPHVTTHIHTLTHSHKHTHTLTHTLCHACTLASGVTHMLYDTMCAMVPYTHTHTHAHYAMHALASGTAQAGAFGSSLLTK